MEKRTTRAFASGLLVSSLLLMGYQHWYGEPKSSATKKGYSTIKTSDLQKIQNDAKEWKKKYQQLQKTKSTSSNAKSTTVKTLAKYHLSITEGMTPEQIGDRLQTGEIVKDSQKFVQFLIDHHYHDKIQIGEYELTNQMNFDSIAKMITKEK